MPVNVMKTDDESERLPAHAELLPDYRIRLPLRYPVSLAVSNTNGVAEVQMISALTMRRLTGEDRLAAEAVPAELKLMALAARASDLPLPLFRTLYRHLDGADTLHIDEVISYFLGSRLRNAEGK
jgi:hypothetical protein